MNLLAIFAAVLGGALMLLGASTAYGSRTLLGAVTGALLGVSGAACIVLAMMFS